MESTIDVKEIERKAYLSFHQDGFLDILAGMFILGLGMAMLEMPGIVATLLWAMPVALFWPMKKGIVYPRLGYVRFGRERRKKEMTKLAVLIALWCLPLIILGIVLNCFPASRKVAWLNEHEILSGQIFMAVFISVGAILSGIKRLYVYAALTLLMFVTDHLLSIPTYLYLIPLGTAILIFGVAVLIRFLHKYPKLAEEVPDGKV